ncbi:threonine/homoserine/homoserine lactone efflux protein [Oxalobacteraceae bacterium GrIS 1.11]
MTAFTLATFAPRAGAMFDALTIAAVLLTPGPTNTLLFLAGAKRGFKASAGLVGSELLGYCLAIGGWWSFLAVAASLAPGISGVARALAALYMAYLAVKMWREANRREQPPALSGPAMFLATLLNPKAFFFAAVVFPAASVGGAALWHAYLLFTSLAAPIGLAWILLGATVSGSGVSPLRHVLIQRTAALVLLGFSMSIGLTLML